MKHKFSEFEISDGWDKLSFFPQAVLLVLRSEFRTVGVLYNAFDDRAGGAALVKQLISQLDFENFGEGLLMSLLPGVKRWRHL